MSSYAKRMSTRLSGSMESDSESSMSFVDPKSASTSKEQARKGVTRPTRVSTKRQKSTTPDSSADRPAKRAARSSNKGPALVLSDDFENGDEDNHRVKPGKPSKSKKPQSATDTPEQPGGKRKAEVRHSAIDLSDASRSSTPEAGGNQVGTADEAVEEDERYEVEAIVGKRRKTGRGKQVQYCVKWVGYAETTWEYSRSLDQCKIMIQAFEAEAAAQAKAKEKGQNGQLKAAAPTSMEKSVDMPVLRSGRKAGGSKPVLVVEKAREKSVDLPVARNGRKAGGSQPALTEKPRPSTSVDASDASLSPRRALAQRQKQIKIADLGDSGIHKGLKAIEILAHKPKDSRINAAEDIEFLVRYSRQGCDEFVPYFDCMEKIPNLVGKYLIRNPLVNGVSV